MTIESVSMEKCWNYFNPPKPEKEIQGSWVACIYASKIPHLFIGHVTKRFLNDADGIYAVALKVDRLQEKYGVTDCVLKEHRLDKKDFGIIPIHDVICGPVRSVFLSALRWEISQYHDIKCVFEKVKKIDREKLHRDYLCKTFTNE